MQRKRTFYDTFGIDKLDTHGCQELEILKKMFLTQTDHPSIRAKKKHQQTQLDSDNDDIRSICEIQDLSVLDDELIMLPVGQCREFVDSLTTVQKSALKGYGTKTVPRPLNAVLIDVISEVELRAHRGVKEDATPEMKTGILRDILALCSTVLNQGWSDDE